MNKIYLQKSVFNFNWKFPLSTKCELPLLDEPAEPVSEDEEEREILAPQLALTKRFLYQAFKGHSAELADICSSLGTAVRMQLTSKASLLQPCYPSKSMVIATNLLACLFEVLFNEMGIGSSKHSVVLQNMAQPKSFILGNIKCGGTKKTIVGYINTCFPLENVNPIIAKQPFYARWIALLDKLADINK